MTNFRFDPPAQPDRPVGSPLAATADAVGTIWAHPNPAELYRWVSRRNELLKTIAAAVAEVGGPTRAMAG